MAKLLLSCDDSIFLNDGRYYAASQEKMDFYQRYLRVFDKLRLVTRCEVDKPMKQDRIPLDVDSRIEYIAVPEFHGPQQYAKVYFRVGNVLRHITEGCDAAVLRIPSTIAMRVGKKVMRKGLPYACEVVFDAEDAWRGSKGLNAQIWKKIDGDMRRLCSSADGVSCVTEHYLQQHYFSNKPQSFSSHYSSLALDKTFFGNAKTYPNHQPFIIAHTSNQVAFNGRKGYNQIIEALKKLKEKDVAVKVRFAGKEYQDGVTRLNAYAQQLGVDKMVEFVGFLNRKELDSFLTDADMYVMPTMAEGLPRVIIEAMSKGLPCITTPVSGNPELVSSHFLVDYYDTQTLAGRIEELTTNSQLYEQISKENYERSLQYEASVLERRRDGFYGKLLALVS